MKRLIILIGFVATVWALYSEPGPLQTTLRVEPGKAAVPSGHRQIDVSPAGRPQISSPPNASAAPGSLPIVSAARPVPRRAKLVPSQKRAVTAEVSRPLFVTGTSVNVRSGPGTQHTALGRLTYAAQVEELGRSHGWVKIEYSSGRRAWMHGDYLSARKPAYRVPARTRQVAAPTTAERSAAAKIMIRDSIAAYPGPCACPYNRMSNGYRCGKRSAWSKPGGYSPLCYESDISPARLATAAARARGASN